MSAVLSGPFTDARPLFAVTVTGHPDAIASGAWQYSVLERSAFDQPGAAELRSYLDAVLWRRRESHRLHVYCRGGDAGIDCLVRSYCEARKISCLPVFPSRDVWGDGAGYRRDLEMLARSAAVVWVGNRGAAPDLVSLAIWLGIPYRVVPGAESRAGRRVT